MDLFTIKCHKCGCLYIVSDKTEEMVGMLLFFHKGSPAIKDRMVLYCNNCGNKKAIGIDWATDLIEIHNQALNRSEVTDALPEDKTGNR